MYMLSKIDTFIFAKLIDSFGTYTPSPLKRAGLDSAVVVGINIVAFYDAGLLLGIYNINTPGH
jgi:hypothetical protein